MYGCESWTVKKAECWRIDAFELWCVRRLLRVPWTAKRSIQSILKEISPVCLLEGLMLKLKLQYFGYPMPRVDPLEKTLILWGIGGRRRRGRQDERAGWHHWLDGYGFDSWTRRKAEQWRIDAFELLCWERLLRVPRTARRSTVLSKGNQSWIFIGRTDAEAKTPVIWPPGAKNWLICKDPEAGKDWRWEE